MLHGKKITRINLLAKDRKKLNDEFGDGYEEVFLTYEKQIIRNEKQIVFADKCRVAEKLGLLKVIKNKNTIIDLPTDIKEIYNYRNKIHIFSSKDEDINIDIELSRKAYRRLEPFLRTIKKQLILDNKL